MKLFRKIFLQVMAGILLITLVTLLWSLNQSQKQELESVIEYEKRSFDERTREFDAEMNVNKINTEDKKLLDSTAIYFFRTIFSDSGALYQGKEELYNVSPFEFDCGKIRKNSKIQEKYSGRMVTEVQNAGDRKLLVFFRDFKYSSEKEYNYQVIYYKDVTDIFVRTHTLLAEGLCFTVVMILIIGVVLFWGIRRCIFPLVELKNAAVKISQGDYEVRVPVKGKDEIGALTESFNQMAAKVQEHTAGLARVNESQRQLLGSLAHELKTPMTAIIGYADTLLTVRLSEKRREQALTYIGGECRRLSRLSVKMLELTGLYEEGDSAMEIRGASVAELLTRLKELTKFRLAPKNITLEISCDPPELKKDMDVDLMMSLLMNLADNACKASPENSVIQVEADEKGIRVTDHGKGIPREELDRVTEAFYMVDKSRSRSAGSVGLGLTLCTQIARMHGAQLVIESEPGAGTTVAILWENER